MNYVVVLSIVLKVLKTVAKAVIATVFTDKFLKELSVHILKSLAQSTDSNLDDEFVAAFHKALIPSDFESEAPSGKQAGEEGAGKSEG